MVKVVIGGMVWKEEIMQVPDAYKSIIDKVNRGESLTDDEWDMVDTLVPEAAYALRTDECSYIGTLEGETILDV